MNLWRPLPRIERYKGLSATEHLHALDNDMDASDESDRTILTAISNLHEEFKREMEQLRKEAGERNDRMQTAFMGLAFTLAAAVITLLVSRSLL